MKPASLLRVVGGLLVLFGGLSVAFAQQMELRGEWTGSDWGRIVFRSDGNGTYSSTYNGGPGRLFVQRVSERHFEGTWSESAQRFGTLVIDVSADGTHATGTWTPDARSTIGTPSGGTLRWTRVR